MENLLPQHQLLSSVPTPCHGKNTIFELIVGKQILLITKSCSTTKEEKGMSLPLNPSLSLCLVLKKSSWYYLFLKKIKKKLYASRAQFRQLLSDSCRDCYQKVFPSVNGEKNAELSYLTTANPKEAENPWVRSMALLNSDIEPNGDAVTGAFNINLLIYVCNWKLFSVLPFPTAASK